MGKTKREGDFKSPRTKRASLTKRPISRIKAHPSSSSVSIPTTNSVANIKVVVRSRPPNNRERGDNCRNIIQVVDEQMLIFDPKEEAKGFFYQGVQQKHRDLLKKTNKHLEFVFDKVFDETVSNDVIFNETTQTLIESLMDGYNCSVFAYGATGAGKTHTMIGNVHSPGITFLTMAELFRRKDELGAERDFDLGISYLEVYNELVQDLLNPGPALYLREDSKYGVIVAGIKVHKIEKIDELFKLLEEGNKNRTQHPTDANAESSRSHAVFQVYLQMKIKATAEVRTAKLSMIDLAGSERGSATGCVGARFTEGANINKSLLALGNCINSLADGHRHIPYRDSKLTRLLKDSLGGNCRTIMIANVSPSSLSYEDTYNTLKYATRAKKIKSSIKKNVLDVELHVGNYVEMVAQLKKELLATKNKLNEATTKNTKLEQQLKEIKEQKGKNVSKDIGKDEPVVQKCTKLETTFVKKDGPVEDNVQLDQIVEQKMKILFRKKRAILERCHKIEMHELSMNLRRQLKEEADSRISDICVGTPTRKLEAHKRLTGIVNRYHCKENVLKEQLDLMKVDNKEFEQELAELLKKEPRLQAFYDLEMEKLEKHAYKWKMQQREKANEIIADDNASKSVLLEKMAQAIKLYHNRLAEYGDLPQDIQDGYEELLKDYEGRKRIRWMDNGTNIVDSGLSSSSSLETVSDVIEKENIQIVPNGDRNDQLDNTFTVQDENSPKKIPKGCAESLMTKVYKPMVPNAPKANNSVYALSPRYRSLQSNKKLMGINTNVSGRVQQKNAALTASKKPPFRT